MRRALLLAAAALAAPGAALNVLCCAGGTRVNKVLRASHSRRAADRLVAEGRVLVNGVAVSAGHMVSSGDEVLLDGERIDWERLNAPGDPAAAQFFYLKLHKPRGVVCTTDRNDAANIIDYLGPLPGVADRIYPIGRLDADSEGLILLTSDGEAVNGLLRARERKAKVYHVSTSPAATDAQITALRSGVTITTYAQRSGGARKPLTAPSLPCDVRRLADPADPGGADGLRIVLEEGRNRQIRRMCDGVGLRVRRLRRVAFAGVTLAGCALPGEWAFLTDAELDALGISPGRAVAGRGGEGGGAERLGRRARRRY